MTYPNNTAGQRDSETISDGLLYKRFPTQGSSHEDMVAWINLMVQWRGESLQITLDTNDGDDPNHGMRYLIGADLYALSEQELEDILPPAWPQRLRMLVSKDVQRFIARKQDDAKKAVRHRTNDMMPIVFAVIIMFAIFSMLDALNGKKK